MVAIAVPNRVDALSRIDDCTPALFSALSDDREVWLRHLFASFVEVTPILIACQQMAGDVDTRNPPADFTTDFRVVRIGDTTFDLEGRLFDAAERVLARATSVIAVADATTSRAVNVPIWLQRTLKKKVHDG